MLAKTNRLTEWSGYSFVVYSRSLPYFCCKPLTPLVPASPPDVGLNAPAPIRLCSIEQVSVRWLTERFNWLIWPKTVRRLLGQASVSTIPSHADAPVATVIFPRSVSLFCPQRTIKCGPLGGRLLHWRSNHGAARSTVFAFPRFTAEIYIIFAF